MASNRPYPGLRRVRRTLLGLAATTALAVLLGVVPVVLLTAWRYLGPPLPSWHELTGPDDGTLFVRMLCLTGWAGWATFTWSVLAETTALICGWRLPAVRWQRRTAASLIAAIAVMLGTPAVAGASATPVRAAAIATAGNPPPAAVDAAPASRTAGGYVEHRVQPGEQMPALAQRYLGDKYRWQAIATATYGIAQPDGRVLHPGDTRIYPGWTVRIPDHHTTDTVAATDHPTTSKPSTAPVYEIARGDWLWHIAGRFLGAPHRYTEIQALNAGLEHRDGRFPDHIEATWRLVLPADAHDRGPRPHATGTLLTPTPPPVSEPEPEGASEPDGPPPGTGSAPNPPPPSTAPSPTPQTSPSPTARPSPTANPSPTTSPAPNRGGTANRDATPAASAPTIPAPNGHPSGEDDSMLDHPILIGVPLFGAGLLAALLLTVLHRHRRRQQQHRPVGHRLPAPVDPTAETHLRVVAEPIAVERLDHTLRVLAAGLADRTTDQMPDIIGAWLHGDTVNLLLTRPCPNPPTPWTGDQLTWTLPGHIDLPDADGQLAPLPTLAAVGSQPGAHLLLDLERLGLLAITGDPTHAEDLLRYLTTELACNTWSDHAEITIAGFDATQTSELIALGGDRIDAAPTIGAAIARIRRRASQVVQSLDHLAAGDPLTGRVADIAADAWMPHILLANNPNPHDITALETLDNDLSATGRCAVAVAVTTNQHLGRWPITIDTTGRLTIPFLGITGDDAELTAAGLPRTELTNLANLLDTARHHATQPSESDSAEEEAWPPVPAAPDTEPWAAGTDAAGALLPEPTAMSAVTDPTDPSEEPPAQTEPPNGHPLAADGASNKASHHTAPTNQGNPPQPQPGPGPKPLPARGDHTGTALDAATRVPTVTALTAHQTPTRKRPTPPVRRRHHDPTLDTDLRAWTDGDPTRPRIAILGPVTVEACGRQPAERLRFYAEIIVYLATRGARGATTDQFDEALWPGQQPKATSRRVAVARARRWLGETPDGHPWLPDATTDRRYHLRDGYLLDWHLFRRLRSRGETRGPAGTTDLRQALELVRGAPLAGADIAYSPNARNPYVWLPTSDIPPHHLTSAITDTAHRLVELCLDAGDTTGARWAVNQAWLADPDRNSDIAWRDQLRVAAAEGNTAELDHILSDLIRTHDAEVPEDLDKDTYRLLCELLPERIRTGIR